MECPPWLAADAKVFWDRLTPPLEKAGLIGDTDETGLAVLCQQVARWRQAETAMDKDGLIITDRLGTKKLHPAYRVADAAMKQIKSMLVQFGFTPRSRGSSAAVTTDELDVFLRSEAIPGG